MSDEKVVAVEASEAQRMYELAKEHFAEACNTAYDNDLNDDEMMEIVALVNAKRNAEYGE